MKIGKRVLSAVTAGICAFSLFSGTAPLTLSAFAADTEYTFDGRPLDDTVGSSLFDIECDDDDVVDNLNSVIERACGEAIGDITYRDLKKITSLDLSEMELTDIPLCIKYMENLRTLDLSFNNLQYAYNVKTLDLSALKRLNYLDVSYNYLNRVPSWFVLDGIDKKYIDGNLLAGDDQRSIKAQTPVYYFMDGEEIDVEKLKEKILADICFDDGSALPDFLYDPDYYPADQPLQIVTDDEGNTPLDDYVNDDDEIELTGDVNYTSVAITVQLFDNANNANTITEIKVFLLDGSSPTTAKARLETLLGEVENLDKTFYTERSWTNFDNAKKTAQAIFDYSNSTAEMLKTALEQLAVAHNSLVLGVDADTKSVLTELTTVGKTYKEEDYTPSSWNSLQKAIDKIAEISSDANATLSSAKSAILSFQNAQKGLEKTKLSVPSVIPKSSFETIFGESGKYVSAKGTTRGGRTYEWRFDGTNVTAPADFNPEISDTPTGEDAIMLESGRAGGYLAFSTAQSGAFAGTGTLTMNVSDKFGDGMYYYYRWNSSGSLIGEVYVKDGKLSVDVSEGGTYYVCNVLQKFELVADKLEIDTANRSIVVPLCTGYDAASFKRLFNYGSSVSVYDLDGKPVSSTARIRTGMKVSAPKGEEYAVTVMGDVNDDGYVNGADAFEILRHFVFGSDSTEQFGVGVTGINIADVNDDGFMNAKDSMLILRAFVG
ncbi:MAG: dockerin type I domain-containing protein [Oscillospiraceae bacterium]